MVFYFTCSDPRYTLYMGKDKEENEVLIQHGWDEDVWFHVDKLSSAHVYLRLPAGEALEDVADEIIQECAQLTKQNSIEGCKASNVAVVYTMWANLKKDGSMAVGQVGFQKNKEVRRTMVAEKDKELIRRLDRSKREAHNDPTELAALRDARDKAEREERRRSAAHERQEAKAEANRRAEEKEARSYDRILGADQMVSNRDALERARLAAPAKSEAELCRDLEDDFM